MSEYAIELESICKAFNENVVLDNVDFQVKKGEVHALVGGNGAGKSVLMKILTGIYQCDSGVIKIDGIPKKISSLNDSTALGVRMVFQELSLIPSLTVMENIFLNHEEKKEKIFLDDKSMKEKARLLISDLDLDIDLDAKVSEFEVGYCQLIEIAKALSVNAKVLVMDEPTASLSETETDMLFKLIKVLKEKGVSIVYISHRMKEIFQIADSITVLRNGQHIITDDVSNFTLESLITHMMGKATENSFKWKDRITPHSEDILAEIENFNYRSVLKDVSFSIKKGEVLGIAGLMGSGRTEILECLFGVRKLSSGRIKMNGKVVKINNIENAIKNKIALVPEDRRRQGLVLMHSVRNNIILASLSAIKKRGFLDDKKSKQIANSRVNDLSIKTPTIERIVRLLSGGNQQKVVISKWLQTEPALLLLDEPTAGVDVSAKGEIIALIRDLAERGKSTILVSSELSELLAVCDRVLVLKKGEVVQSLLRKEIESEEVLQHAVQQ